MKTQWSLFVVLALTAGASAQVSIQKVVVSGEEAVGTGGVFGQLYSPIANSAGRVLFLAEVAGYGRPIYTWGGEGLTLAGWPFQPAPDTSPGTYFTTGSSGSGPFENYTYRSSDRIAVAALIAGPAVQSSNNEGIWYFDGGVGSLVAREGDHPPGTPAGVTFLRLSTTSSVARLRLNDSGRFIFTGMLQGPGVTSTNHTSIWTWSPGTGLQLLLRGGDAIPGTSRTALYVTTEGRVNGPGQVCFGSRIVGGTEFAGVLLRGTPGDLEPVAVAGDAAPGLPDGVSFSGFYNEMVLEDNGAVTFIANLAGPGLSDQNNVSLWRAGQGGPALIARRGDDVPGLPDFKWWTFTPVTTNDQGTVVFTARVTRPGIETRNSIWLRRPDGSLQLIMKDGDPALGAPAEYGFTGGGLIAINNSDQMVFGGGVINPPLPGSGVLGWTPELGLFVVVMRDTLLELPDSSVRSVFDAFLTGVEPVSGPDLPSSSLTDSGQIAFQINFTDLPFLTGVFTGMFQEFASKVMPCRADLNQDGLVDFADYLEFLNFYDAGDTAVDFNGDGLVDFADYLEFLNLYDAGC